MGGQCADEGQSARWGAECPMGSSTPGQNCTRWEAECDKGLRARTEVHPMGSRAPDGEQYTWTELHPMGSRVRQGAARPDRSAPDGEQYTRWGAVHLDRTGAMHTDRVSCPHQQAQTRRTAACRDTRRRCGWLDSLRCVWGDAERGPSTWIAVRVGTMAAPPRPPPRRVDRGACGGRRRAWAIDVDLGAACASVGGHARVAAGMGAGRLGRLGSLDGGLSAVDGDVAVDDDARFRREEAGHRRLAL